MTREQLQANTEIAKQHIVVRGNGEWVVPSRRQIGQVYIVARRKGQMTCNCEAALRGIQCWHIAAVNERFAAPEPEESPEMVETRRQMMNLLRGKPQFSA